MLELEAAQDRILALVPAPDAETVALKDAAGRILVETVVSDLDLPAFDNSMMDGYAVRAADTTSAKHDNPVSLRQVGRAAAGEVWAGKLGPCTCVRVFTGSPLPAGADAVVMQEDTHVNPANPEVVAVLEAAKPWENVRFRGEDVKRGSAVAMAGESISSAKLNLLASTGRTRVAVGRQPVVGFLATGSELVEPGGPLPPGSIFESNRVALADLTRRAGGEAKIFPIVPDQLEGTRQALKAALAQCDFLVTTGGVSVGELDFVKPALEGAGAKLDFWKVAIRPGRPFVLGQLGSKLIFGLPGNPVSAFVTFLLLVQPAIRRSQGARATALPTHDAVLAESLRNQGGRRHFVRVTVDAQGQVRSSGVQASHILSSLAAANGLLDMAPRSVFEVGASVKVMRFEW